MRAKLATLNHCAVPVLSRAAVNLSWYDSCICQGMQPCRHSLGACNPQEICKLDRVLSGFSN